VSRNVETVAEIVTWAAIIHRLARPPVRARLTAPGVKPTMPESRQ
jgi:hypothetical protein